MEVDFLFGGSIWRGRALKARRPESPIHIAQLGRSGACISLLWKIPMEYGRVSALESDEIIRATIAAH